MHRKGFKLVVLPGDGIGQEVTLAAIPILNALNIPLELHFGDIGWACWQQEGNPLPQRTWQLINKSDAVLLGAITSKPQREAMAELNEELKQKKLTYLSPLIQLRQQLDLFANVRPCYSIQEQNKPFNFCIIRENTEGLYAGFDYYPMPSQLLELIAKNSRWQEKIHEPMSCSLRVQSESGLTRLFQFAFEYAQTHQLNRVSFADKPNVLRQSAHFARELFEQVANQNPHIEADILNVDAVGLWLVKRPENFGVIVAENMFGDILSDVGAGVMGGLGFAPSANIGKHAAYFEPVHGSAPHLKANTANPSAMFLTISLLLNHLGFHQQAEKIKQAVIAIVNQCRYVTADLGGQSSTQEMAKAIIDDCIGR